MVSYKTIQLPEEFVTAKIDPLVGNKAFGYTSRAQLVVDAVKRLYAELQKEISDEHSEKGVEGTA